MNLLNFDDAYFLTTFSLILLFGIVTYGCQRAITLSICGATNTDPILPDFFYARCFPTSGI